MSDDKSGLSDGSFSQIEAKDLDYDNDADSTTLVAEPVIVLSPPSNVNKSHDEVALEPGEIAVSHIDVCREEMKDEISKLSDGDKSTTDDLRSITDSSYCHVSGSGMSIGSSESAFEKILLSSGIVVSQCLRCNFHNSMDDNVCAMCHIALVANPSPDQDLQISLHLQEKEKQNDEAFVKLYEARRSELHSAPLVEQASFLVDDIHSYLRAYPAIQCLSLAHMRSQAISFIAKTLRSKPSDWYIGCVFVQEDALTFDLIERQGFQPSTSTNFQCQLALATNIADAWKYYTTLSPENRPGKQLPSSTKAVENLAAASSVHQLNGTGWLVAVSRMEQHDDNTDYGRLMLGGGIQKVNASETLPLVAFSGKHLGMPDLSMVQNGLKNLLKDFFQAAIAPVVVPVASESPGLVEVTPIATRHTVEQMSMRLNGEDNMRTSSVKQRDAGRLGRNNISEARGDVSSDTIVVTNKLIVDMYGENGIYSGALSKSTGMPNGKGRLEYEKEGRWYEGDWSHGLWTGFGCLSNGEGDLYKGGLKDDHKHGAGVMKFADGRIFEGEYIRGEMIQGKMTYPDGCVYEGSWVDGMRHGRGKCIFVDGSEYEGKFREGNFHGHGQMIWDDGGWYIGEWCKGEMHGKGKEIRADGSLRHDGEWSRGQPIRDDGEYVMSQPPSLSSVSLGIKSLPRELQLRDDDEDSDSDNAVKDDHSVYEDDSSTVYAAPLAPRRKSSPPPSTSVNFDGDEDDDTDNGVKDDDESEQGAVCTKLVSCIELEDEETHADVSSDTIVVTNKLIFDMYGENGIYSGALSKSTGMPNGKGRLEYEKEGRWYEGDWIHGRWNGYGRLSNGDGNFYEGGFKNDHKHGAGVMKFADGRIFEGQYIRGEMIRGKMTYEDGSVYQGPWRDGLRHGRGKCTFVDGSNYEGEFREGNYHGKGQMTWNDGGWYVGEWCHGEMHGKGKEIRPDGSVRHDGEWSLGKPVRSRTRWTGAN